MENFFPFQCETRLQIRPRATVVSPKGRRIFLHVDLDAFFASVEQIKNPSLKGKPVIVGGRNSRRGVVAAASYEAKRFGIETGMPWQQAKEKCPNAIFLPADFDAYSEYSEKVERILKKMAPVVAPASVDESYLDLTGCEAIYGTPRNAAEKIHREIEARTGLSVSIGIAAAQSVAKMASKMSKPCGMMEVPKGAEEKFLAPFPVEMMPGIGSQIGAKLRGMGIITLGQLAQMPSALLRASFGIYGPFLKAKALGQDTWALEVTEVIKSIGKQKTLEEDVSDFSILRRELRELVEMVGRKLREENCCARSILVHVRYADFTPPPVPGESLGPKGQRTGGGVTSEGTSKTLKDPTNFDRVLFQYAQDLLVPLVAAGHPERSRRIRLIGFTAQNLTPPTPQLDLFRTPQTHKWERFYTALDSVRQMLGKNGKYSICQ